MVKMTEESIKRTLDIVEMKLRGLTYQEIADKYGISKQRVYSILNNEITNRKFNSDDWVYKGLRSWMLENHINSEELGKIINVTGTHVRRKLYGKTDFRLKEIVAIIKKSGLTFEQLFLQE